MDVPALKEVGRTMQIIDLLSLVSDVTSLAKDLSEFLSSDSPVHLGIVLVGLVKPKKEDN